MPSRDPQHGDIDAFFRLKPPKGARVSEISEATAASGTAPEDRVNFHIGNPVQDPRLTSAYLRIALGLDIRREDLRDDDPDAIAEQLQWTAVERPILDFLTRLVQKSGPYTPRGGYARNSPNVPAQAFLEWLEHQHEPLTYDSGKTSGKREVLLASGGLRESLRILFHALSSSLLHGPGTVFLLGIDVPWGPADYPGLRFEYLNAGIPGIVSQLETHFRESDSAPAFLVLGCVPDEETRRSLRQLSLHAPLFIVEANDAPNQLSLAREAKLVHRVLRFFTPAIFDPRFRGLSVVLVAGPSDLLAAFDAFHFQLKGTPSASEMELLAFLLSQQDERSQFPPEPSHVLLNPPAEGISPMGRSDTMLVERAQRLSERLDEILSRVGATVEARVERIARYAERLAQAAPSHKSIPEVDPFAHADACELTQELTHRIEDASWHTDLQRSFLNAFVSHHPEYDRKRCAVVSGSSRTALGLLGFHCGISEVIIPDLSWSYEHCFPQVQAVPLTATFGLDPGAIIEAVRHKIENDPRWTQRGAVVLNNPHNATGRVFDREEVRRLVAWLLQNDVYVIDDLSYQEVAPGDDLPGIETVRQAADAMVRAGDLREEQATRVITVHSVSKTDCMAGARLAVVEIRDSVLHERFTRLNEAIAPNLAAITLNYLFYRGDREAARAFGVLRNRIFLERSQALLDAVAHLPKDRNPFHIGILPPTGSMYPLLVIERLPSGLSLDWLASGLARQGIGMLPLSTFSRTEEGFERGRKAFRLTLGGTDGADVLLNKTRRVVIDLNRLIAEEAGRYNRNRTTLQLPERELSVHHREREAAWTRVEDEIIRRCSTATRSSRHLPSVDRIEEEYVRERMLVFRRRFQDRMMWTEKVVRASRADDGRSLARLLEQEFYKDSLPRRERAFHDRMYDRTVHPTQMYSIRLERAFDDIVNTIVRGRPVLPRVIREAAEELSREFAGMNVAIASSEESDELLLDLDAIVACDLAASISGKANPVSIVSFWGDWDGSNRPSGQGHRLVATTLIANVNRLARILTLVATADPGSAGDGTLMDEIARLPRQNERFMRLLNEITSLTHHLEKRYRGVLPISLRPGRWRRWGMRFHLARDPLSRLWRHNDRLERKMVDLRRRRREMLQHYFALNKRLRKHLAAAIPAICLRTADRELTLEAATYRDLLQRLAITPRIHQNMITAQDSFAIDTTVHNICEINAISGSYGNPGIILALQVSMSTKAEALITLDRKLRARREQTLRENPGIDLPQVRLIPLFEDLNAVAEIPAYLAKIWDYALQSRPITQDPEDRFAEIIAEVFIAGSDLSQQVGQAAGAVLYRKAKREIILWLAEHRLVDRIRLKMGSGEPMQRQGGYYAPVSGLPAFERSPEELRDTDPRFTDSARRSTAYAATPLMGLFTGGDLRTLQSNVSEHLRSLPVEELLQVMHHLRESQRQHRSDLVRAAESLVETRLQRTARGARELDRLTIGTQDAVVDRFAGLLTEEFRHILYGREEDVVGMHLISYFIGRTIPQLRDRPTVRPGARSSAERGQRILENIAQIIPMAKHGSLLRAIAHNQAQTMVVGFNQLTTGLFRALDRFAQLQFSEGEASALIVDRILPQLPVYEILNSLRIYHDPDLTYIRKVEPAFPAGNSAFLALREDNDGMRKYLSLFQQELIRRHGLTVSEFFDQGVFFPPLLPAVRPDLAVLLQQDLFNADPIKVMSGERTQNNEAWNSRVDELLQVPTRIRFWRSKVWELLEEPIVQRIQGFAELAVALSTLSAAHPLKQGISPPPAFRLSSGISSFFRSGPADDEMRQFLASALDYLSAVSEGMAEVPVAIVRSLKDLERIVRIEEQALAPRQQEQLRFYMLQMARLAGENG